MKQLIIPVLLTLFIAFSANAQKKKDADLNLKNALVIGQFDRPEDRYSIEINLTDMLASRGVKAMPSLNILKLGESAEKLATDSLQQVMTDKGIDTYILVSVRGYDRKYKPSDNPPDFATAITGANLFELYQMDIVSISFDFKFFRNGVCVHNEVVKCGNVGDRDAVLKKFRKKVAKRIDKKWLK